jgi:hypothetical protein
LSTAILWNALNALILILVLADLAEEQSSVG